MNVVSVVITFWFLFIVNNNIDYFLTNCLFLISYNDIQTCIVTLKVFKSEHEFQNGHGHGCLSLNHGYV